METLLEKNMLVGTEKYELESQGKSKLLAFFGVFGQSKIYSFTR